MSWSPESGTPPSLAAFERAAPGYEAAAELAAEIHRELLLRLEPLALKPGAVLDVGAGTGLAAAALKARYRRALVIALDRSTAMLREVRRHERMLRRIARVRGDAMRLPLAAASIDVVFSNLVLHWCEPRAALAEMQRVLKPEGVLVLSTLGPDTLIELRRAWAAADPYTQHVGSFLDLHDVGDLLVQAGFAEPVLDVERRRVHFPDVHGLGGRLRRIGASGVPGRRRTLTGKARFEGMRAAYESERESAGLPASIEIVYAIAWGGPAGSASRHPGAGASGEVRIAPEAIRRHR